MIMTARHTLDLKTQFSRGEKRKISKWVIQRHSRDMLLAQKKIGQISRRSVIHQSDLKSSILTLRSHIAGFVLATCIPLMVDGEKLTIPSLPGMRLSVKS